MRPAITVDGLSKLYRVGARQQGYKTLRESIADACWAPLRRLRRGLEVGRQKSEVRPPTSDHKPPTFDRLSGQDFWALKDMSFEVQPGEVVGIIGRNGAGKSTLLKILSRITEPTSGKIELRGRVGSLLEVGTGFHPELTGRENVYMNGSILGMSRREIARKFDEIVAFAEIEDFLDTPVKRYSSGMYVRLAFAVAAHLEPEILIVDEVLAVGDAGFQKKCLGKMQDVASHGRTVLFVSHNMATIANLCKEVIVLQGGRLQTKGATRGAITQYCSQSTSTAAQVDLRSHAHRPAGVPAILRGLCLRNGDDCLTDQFCCGEPITFELDVQPWSGSASLEFTVAIHDAFGTKLFTAASYLSVSRLRPIAHDQRVRCALTELPLAPGRYSVSVCGGPLHQSEMDLAEQVAWFDVVESDYYGNGRRPHPARGFFLVKSQWEQSPARAAGGEAE